VGSGLRIRPVTMDNPPTQHTPPGTVAAKKGLGTGAKIGLGCGALVLLVIIGIVVVGVIFGGKLKEFVEEAQENPTRATAAMMVSASRGSLEMVAEDDEGKRYTLRDTKSGKFTTVYWDAAKNAPEVIEGEFSDIPAQALPVAPEGNEESGVEPIPDSEGSLDIDSEPAPDFDSQDTPDFETE
jgi:hypothetical protein